MINPTQDWPRYATEKGICINADCEKVIDDYLIPNYSGQIQLILTSPPFPLKRAKKYGNKTGQEYLDWFCNSSQPRRGGCSEAYGNRPYRAHGDGYHDAGRVGGFLQRRELGKTL